MITTLVRSFDFKTVKFVHDSLLCEPYSLISILQVGMFLHAISDIKDSMRKDHIFEFLFIFLFFITGQYGRHNNS
jgi:hypothetical protein